MTHTEHPHDAAVARELRDAMSGIDVPARPPIEAIAARGRARRRRRTAGLAAGLGTACAVVAAVAAAGLTGAEGPASPARHAGTGGTASGTIRTAAFTLTRNADGTETLRLSTRQMFDPAELQRALARDGIPSLVKIGTSCSSTPPLPSPVSLGVLRIERPDGAQVGPPAAPGRPGPQHVVIPADAVNVINPARMPAGSELYFDYVSHGLTGGLINPDSYTCHAGAMPATPLVWPSCTGFSRLPRRRAPERGVTPRAGPARRAALSRRASSCSESRCVLLPRPSLRNRNRRSDH